ncbi:MAG: hypothetical protein EOP88_20080 [Verrucomicrobiaceae bacterium]|nr:MAG: hypothetical protein EOP88_20080 [Verrucomicrobiaceae bacterium]
MTPHWYRSRLFWSGLAGLAMLLVAWIGFRKASYFIDLGVRGHFFSLSNSPADFMLGYADLSPDFRSGSYDALEFDWKKLPHRDLVYDDMFGNPFYSELSADSIYLYIAIWFVVATYIVLWICCMIWWQRRKHRLMTNPLDSVGVSP